jgi:fucose 4-O-acetylase-like acetyltransferase
MREATCGISNSMTRNVANDSSHADVSDRWEDIDVARGVLLVAMVLVHIVSRYATGAQSGAFHQWLGIFLVSSGFVGLSGYVTGARGGSTGKSWLRAFESALHLLLVMGVYGILISLLEHGCNGLAGGSSACTAEFGWAPPVRFESLGILLPIAIVQVMAPAARARGRWVSPAVLVLAVAWMLLPELEPREDSTVQGILTGRTLTPYYTVSTFVAVGLAWAVLGRGRWHEMLERRSTPTRRLVAAPMCLVLAIPAVSTAVLDPAHHMGGPVLGAVATLLYWTIVISAFLLVCTAGKRREHGAMARFFSLLGRNSLLVFVLHAILLELNQLALTWTSTTKGFGAVVVLVVLDVAILGWIASNVERHSHARTAARVLLLDRGRRPATRTGPFSPFGLLAAAVVLAVYTSAALAGAQDDLVVDDMQRKEGCPAWWYFGDLEIDHVNVDPSGKRVMRVRGRAPGMFAHGMGLFMERDIGKRRTLHLDVRGHGPDSGRIKIELLEDDNGNWEIEKDPRLFMPLHDDRFVYEFRVDWDGWRHIVIATDEFIDDNPGKGNDEFDPYRDMTSGGLLEIQILFAPTKRSSDDITIDIGEIRWSP